MKYIIELEDEPNESYFGEGNFYRCKQIPYWSISESMRNRLEPYDEADRKTEPTISKMEQVDEPQYDFGEYADRLWKIAYERGKREALEQTEPSCDTCKLKDTTEWCKRQEVCRAYQPKDEPQTERSE